MRKGSVMVRRRGFTLIELLVVISIIALLLAILMPALTKAKLQALDVACRSNMKQWALIWSMYTGDNEGLFPSEDAGSDINWLGATKDYVKDDKIRFCTRAKKTMYEGARQPFAATEQGGYKGSYGVNDYIVQDVPEQEWGDILWKQCNVKEAAQVPVMAGCVLLYIVTVRHSDDPPEYEGDVIYGSGPAGGEMKRFCVNRHNGYTNGLLMDWSARKIGLKELWELKWHRKWNPNNDPPPIWPDWMKGFKDYSL